MSAAAAEGPSNDELLYDPDMDDDDQRWVNRQRLRYQPQVVSARQASDRQASGVLVSGGAGGGTRRKLPNSDAVLNCPACMSLLCLDCQRSVTHRQTDRQSTDRHSWLNGVTAGCWTYDCKVVVSLSLSGGYHLDG